MYRSVDRMRMVKLIMFFQLAFSGYLFSMGRADAIQCFPFRSIPFSFRLSVRVVGCCRFFPLKGLHDLQIQFTRWAKARVHAGRVASSTQDPYWWQWLPHKVPTAHQEQLWGSVSCSRILQHVAQSRPGEPGFRPAIFRSLVHQLYPLSSSRPWFQCSAAN